MKATTLRIFPKFYKKNYIEKLISNKNWVSLNNAYEGGFHDLVTTMLEDSIKQNKNLLIDIVDFDKYYQLTLLNKIDMVEILNNNPEFCLNADVRTKIIATVPKDKIALIYSICMNYGYVITKEDLEKNPNLCNDYEFMENVIKKDPSLISLSNINDERLYEIALTNGYVPTKEDLISNPNLCNSLIVIEKVIENDPSLVSMSRLSDVNLYAKAISNDYVPTKEEVKSNPFLTNNKTIMETLIKKDISYLELADLKDNYFYELTLSIIKSTLNDELKSNMLLVNKAISGGEISQEKLQTLYRLGQLCMSLNANYVPTNVNINEIDLNRIKDTLAFHYMDYMHILNDAIKLLDNNEVEKGKYQIPKFCLLQDIVKLSNKIGQNINIFNFENSFEFQSIRKYQEYNGYFDYEFGKELEDLYFDPNIILGIHGSRDSIPEDDKDKQIQQNSFFDNGIENRYRHNINLVVMTQFPNVGLQDFLGYSYGQDSYKFIIAIPKEGIIPPCGENKKSIPIWKKLSGDSSIVYLLPQYVYGCVDLRNPKARIINNPKYGKMDYTLNENDLVYDDNLKELLKLSQDKSI